MCLQNESVCPEKVFELRLNVIINRVVNIKIVFNSHFQGVPFINKNATQFIEKFLFFQFFLL